MDNASTNTARKFAGRVAIVTGSTSGIGLAIAQAMAAEGADIVMNGFVGAQNREQTLENIEKLRAELAAKYKVRVIFDAADMSKPRQIRQLVKRTIVEFGKVDVVVNNAGIQHVAPIEKFSLKKWDEIIAVNLTAPFVMTKAVIPHMRKRGFGRIINIGSAHSKVASLYRAAYCSAKHGLLGLTRVVALETANDGITINTICPAWVDTALAQVRIKEVMESSHLSYEEATKKLLEKQPMKQLIKTEHVAAYAVFLASDAAAAITGTDPSIDGGFVAA